MKPIDELLREWGDSTCGKSPDQYIYEVASQQTASLQKQVEELREEIKSREAVSQIDKKRIAQLEEALKELYSFTPDLHSSTINWEGDFHKAILKAKKALNPQDNQKEK